MKSMTKRKKSLLAAALVVWVLGALWLASKTLDDFRSGRPSGGDESLTLERIMFPSQLSRDQEESGR